MQDDIPSEKMLQAALRYGGDFAEVFAERTHRTSIIADDRKIERAASFSDSGVGIRVIKDGCVAYGHTNDLTKRGLLDLARRVGRERRAKRSRCGHISLEERQARARITVRQHPFGVSLKSKCDMVVRASETAWGKGSAIKQVRVAYRDAVRRLYIASSDGRIATDEQVDTALAVHVVAGDDRGIQTGFEPIGGAMGFEIFDATPPEEAADRAASRAIRMLSARQMPAGPMAVVLSSEAGGTMIHEAVGHGLEADLVADGHSVYAGRLGEVVASELVTVVDDATLPMRRGSFTFDDEGECAARTVLIERGVLRAYLSDRQSARQLNIPLTGNGRRQGYDHPPLVRMTNTMIAPGADEPARILSETASGLFVRKMGGGQVSTVNGDFVFEVQEGYLIEGGKRGEPVRGATLIGNGPKVLASIDRVGSDIGFSIGMCGKGGQEVPVSSGQPTIRIPKITVGGTAQIA